MPRCPSCEDYLNVPEAKEKGLCEICEEDKHAYPEPERKNKKEKKPTSIWSEDMLKFLNKLKGVVK